MQHVAHIARRQAGHCPYFLIAHPLLEFKGHYFALPCRKLVHKLEQRASPFLGPRSLLYIIAHTCQAFHRLRILE